MIAIEKSLLEETKKGFAALPRGKLVMSSLSFLFV